MSRAALLDRAPARDPARDSGDAGASRIEDAVDSTKGELAPREPEPGSERRGERPRPGDGRSRAGAGGGRLALGDLVAGAWEGLLAAGSTPCPVCSGLMERRGVAGHCRRCGSMLT